MEVEEIISEVVKIIRRYLPEDYRILLFGSQASGDALKVSDIDVGILGSEEVSQRIIRRIREEVEAIPTLRKIDVVDFKAVDDDFRENALRNSKELTVSTN